MKVRWYFTDLPFQKHESIINSRDWEENPYNDPLVGEQDFDNWNYNGAEHVPGLIGGHECGELSDFQSGQPWPYTGPPIEYSADHIPLCCPRAIIPDVIGGTVADLTQPSGYTRAPTAGSSVDYVLPPPPVLSVTAGSSVDAGQVLPTVTAGSVIDIVVTSVIDATVIAGTAVDYLVTEHEQVYTEPGTYSFTATVTGLHILECWAGGGGGEDPHDDHSGTGGGGGGYSRALVSLTAGDSLNVNVGAGGPHGFGAVPPGDDSAVIDTFSFFLCRASGGLSGAGGGTGGGTGTAVGDVKNAGGNGAPNDGTVPGGGGSSASLAGNGNTAIDIQGAIAPPGGGDGGWGQTHTVDQFPKRPGGGGGGGEVFGPTNGDPGADGKVRIVWFG